MAIQWQDAYIVGSFGNVGESWGNNGRLGDIKRERHADTCQGQVVVLEYKILAMVCPGLFDENGVLQESFHIAKITRVYPFKKSLTKHGTQSNGPGSSRPHLSLQ